jgi:hypothetical protein
MSYLLFSLLPIFYVLYTIANLHTYHKSLRHLPIPIFISPVSPINPIWTSFRTRLIPLVNKLPFGLGAFARMSYFGWSFDDKYAVHEELGDLVGLVTPGGNELHVADAEAMVEIMARRRDFPKPVELYSEYLG